ncbi:MAG TPA: glycosyltransferase family 2 protein [Anaerolineae bacterium]|nr:glycosyltransferase family 2 protein [Anaerolineae bacterium]HOQ99708.1 glycosyltransferase family 2 protein [Anaerolineae bacterium]HPL26627.1 glycosyltransferase family 2 protein [Anaerolineae bacterium]
MYETALHAEAKRRIREIGAADLVIGIPTYRNGRTLGRVLDAAVAGLARDFPNARAVIMIADGGSSDNTLQVATDWPTPPTVKKIVTPYEGLLGRGSALRAVFEVAAALGSRVCIVLSPDARDITPQWLGALAAPILAGQCDLVLPNYDRPPLESALTDHIVYPVLRMLYGADLRHVIGSDLAIASPLAGQYALRDVWETDVARHGLDVWLTVVNMIEGRRIGEACLGTKMEGLRDFVVPLDPRFLHTIGTLFRLINIYRRVWVEASVPAQLTHFGTPQLSLANSRPGVPIEDIWEAAGKGRSKYRSTWRAILASEQLERLREVLRGGPAADTLPAELWARIVVDFAVVYNKGEGDPDKVICALLPIYYARVVSYLLETQRHSPEEYEAGIQNQATIFEAQRPYLRARWDTYVPWLDDGAR